MLKLGLDAGQYVDAVFDQINDCWDTARRAWLTFDPEATHHLVIQDDAVVCRDLIRGVERALEFVPADSIQSLYVGTRRPVAHSVRQAVRAAREQQPSWIVMNGLHWGVAVVIPVPEIRAMVDWCDQQTIRGDDNRIRRYFVTQKRWPTWCSWPSLVNHRQIASVLKHASGRVAHEFIGEDTSALDVKFDLGHITMDEVGQVRTPIRRRLTMNDNATAAKKTTAKKTTARKTAAKKATASKVDEVSAEITEAKTSLDEAQADLQDLKTETVLEEPRTEPQLLTVEPQPEHAPPAPNDNEPQADQPESKGSGEVVELSVEDRPKFPKDNIVRRTDRRTTTRSSRFHRS